jgi:hypothetical protein
MVPLAITYTGEFFNEDAQFTPQNWTNYTNSIDDLGSNETFLQSIADASTASLNPFLAIIGTAIDFLPASIAESPLWIGGLVNAKIDAALEGTAWGADYSTNAATSNKPNWIQSFIIKKVDKYFDWAVQPIYDYYQNFLYSLRILSGTFGINAQVIAVFLGVFWLIPLLIAVLLILRIAEVVGGFFPG